MFFSSILKMNHIKRFHNVTATSASEMVWASLLTPSMVFSKACPDIFYADFATLQKGCHNIVNIITLLRCR